VNETKILQGAAAVEFSKLKIDIQKISNTMIEVKDITKIYSGVTVLNIPDLKIEQGESFGLVGNNGAAIPTFC